MNEFQDIWKRLTFPVSVKIVAGSDQLLFARHPDELVEVGSSFKAFIVAEALRQLEENKLTLDDALILQESSRVPASDLTDTLEDGQIVNLFDAMAAMISVSDNTATDLVLERVGHQNTLSLIRKLGLNQTFFPVSTKKVYEKCKGNDFEVAISTPSEMILFYQQALSLFKKEQTISHFKAIMNGENVAQNMILPNNIGCFRKGGFLDLDDLCKFGLSGFCESQSQSIYFAFYCTLNKTQPAFEDDFQDFQAAVGESLKIILEMLISD